MVEKSTVTPHKKEVNVEEMIYIFFKWKWVLLFFSLTVPIIALLMMLMVKPIYSASSTVTLKSSSPETESISQSIMGSPQGLDALNEDLFIKSSAIIKPLLWCPGKCPMILLNMLKQKDLSTIRMISKRAKI